MVERSGRSLTVDFLIELDSGGISVIRDWAGVLEPDQPLDSLFVSEAEPCWPIEHESDSRDAVSP